MCGLCEVSIVDEVEVEKQFSVGDSVFYKAESKVSPATITAVTDHVDSKAYNIELAKGVELVANSEDLFPSTPPPIPLQIGGDLVTSKQCRAIVCIGVIMLASCSEYCLPWEAEKIWQPPPCGIPTPLSSRSATPSTSSWESSQ